MQNETPFLRFAAIAAFITALTTIGVHYVEFPIATLEDRLQLTHNTGYYLHRWMIILHCFCVIVSMLGIAVLKFKERKGFITLGFLFYTVFGVVEMARMMLVLFYLNGLRLQYLDTTDEMLRAALVHSMDQFSLVGNALFSLFALAFGIGNLCYGIVLSADRGITRWLGYGFLYWATTSFLGLANQYMETAWIGTWMEYNGKVFQPVFRLLIGIWLWREVKRSM